MKFFNHVKYLIHYKGVLMKKMIILSILVVNLFAQDINAILDKYMEAWNEHDRKKIETFYTHNVQWYDSVYDQTIKGKKAVGKAITDAFLNNVKDMYWVKSGDVFISDDTVTYQWIYGGKADGNVFEVKGISTTTFVNGKIVAQKDYYNK